MTDTNNSTALAQIAYQAYGSCTGWKNYQGQPMPVWAQLGDPIQKAWQAATDAVVNELTGPTADD